MSKPTCTLYLQPKDGLPDPRSALSLAVPSQAIDEANRDVHEATSNKNRDYKRCSASVRAEIGRYAIHHGVAAAARYFSKKHVSYGFVLHIKPGNEVSVDRSVKIFLWVTQTTKILSHGIITRENFIPRKFPKLRYTLQTSFW